MPDEVAGKNIKQAALKAHFPNAAPGAISKYLDSLRWIEQTLFQWASIVESADDAIIGKDLRGIITSWNRSAQTMYGYTAKEIVGKSILTLFPKKQKAELTAILSKIKRGQQLRHYQTKRVRKNGKVIDVSVTISPIRDIAGKIVGASTIARNITEQKLIDNERLNLAAIIDSSDEAIISQSKEGKIISWNKAAQKLFGYNKNQATGESLSFLFKNDDNKTLSDRLNKPEKKYDSAEYEVEAKNKNGKMISVSMTLSPIRSDNGDLVGTSIIARDISKRREYEHRKDMAIIAKDEFVSLVSHQLRAPVTVAKQYIGMLSEGYGGDLTDQQKLCVSKAAESVERQLIVIDRMLEITRADAGKVVLNKEKLNLTELLRVIVNDYMQILQKRKQRVDFQFQHSTFEIVADKSNLRMVIENIIDNASKYTPTGKSIFIDVMEKRGHAFIAIKDEGVGIPKKDVYKVFDKFTRLENSLSGSTKGSGLGMYWANKIISMHNGKINVESEPSKGTIFTVMIPT